MITKNLPEGYLPSVFAKQAEARKQPAQQKPVDKKESRK